MAARPTGWTAWRIHANPRRFELPQLVPAAPEGSTGLTQSRELALNENGERVALPCSAFDTVQVDGSSGAFRAHRFLGDKRTQLVYDLDSWGDAAVIDEIVGAEVGTCFGPDTLAEARNRGYTLAREGTRRLRRKPRA